MDDGCVTNVVDKDVVSIVVDEEIWLSGYLRLQRREHHRRTNSSLDLLNFGRRTWSFVGMSRA